MRLFLGNIRTSDRTRTKIKNSVENFRKYYAEKSADYAEKTLDYAEIWTASIANFDPLGLSDVQDVP